MAQKIPGKFDRRNIMTCECDMMELRELVDWYIEKALDTDRDYAIQAMKKKVGV